MVAVVRSCLIPSTAWTVACQAPLSMGFSRQEYWSVLSFSSPKKTYIQCLNWIINANLKKESCESRYKTDKGELKKEGYLRKIIFIWCKMSKNVKLMHPRDRKVMGNRKEMGNNQGAIHIRKSFKII